MTDALSPPPFEGETIATFLGLSGITRLSCNPYKKQPSKFMVLMEHA